MVPLPDSVSFLINGGLSTPLNKPEVNQTTVFNTFTHQVWYWGGFSDYQTGRNGTAYWEGMASLDTVRWQWTSSRGTTGGYLNSRYGHTMTLLPNEIIHIIGGYIATLVTTSTGDWRFDLASMGTVPVFDTVKGTWSSKIASGSIPAPRTMHNATLARDGNTIVQKVLIHVITTNNGTALYNDLYTFDANKASWTQIAIGNAPATRAGHSAVQVNETMFVLFGRDASSNSLNDIYALDTVNWKWITQFNASGYQQQSNSSYAPAVNGTQSSTCDDSTGWKGSALSTGAIAGIVVGCIVVLIALGLLAYCMQRKSIMGNYNNQQPRVVEYHLTGNVGSDMFSASAQKDWKDNATTYVQADAPFSGSQGTSSFHTTEGPRSTGYTFALGPHQNKPDAV
ncbi:Leucine-zipper-like transcriptional regulator 1 [Umbelopsis nana]